MKGEIWVIIANSSQARIFKAGPNREQLDEIEALVHPESRMHTGDIISDNQGEAVGSTGNERYPMEPATSPKKNEHIAFARQISSFLEDLRNQGKIEKIYLAANPAFLGLLRQELSSTISQCVQEEIGKDITHLTNKEIREYFPYVL